MRISQFLLATVKETPTDAEIISHKLMLRAGLIRKVAAGIYNWLPLGFRVLKKVEQVVREEMNKAGALEILMPVVQPAELWQESQRWQAYGPELLRFCDRHDREFCLGPTHEEVITDLMRRELKSYRQLPVNLYQIQFKFRDEIRPRFGVMRAREFLMKDAYSFHLDKPSLEATYQKMYDTYQRIFTRLGLQFRAVLADTGSIGGNKSHEFQVLAESGEDVIAISDSSDYAANVELAEALPPSENRAAPKDALKKISTPNIQTIDEVATFLNTSKQKVIKTLIVHGQKGLVALIIRGDHELNSIKVEKLADISKPLRFANEQEIQEVIGCKPGYLGPVGLNLPIVVDRDVTVMSDFICGANESGYHLMNVNWERDASFSTVADIRKVITNDLSPDGKGRLQLVRGIEVGHIFQLGNKYSKALQAVVLDEQGRETMLEMGCYGIGVSRIVAAAIEQHHDERGIIWPLPMAPFHISIIPINPTSSQKVASMSELLYSDLTKAGFAVLLDDRDERAGVMFADHDLIGIPYRVVISERGLANNTVEVKHRSQEQAKHLSINEVLDFFNKEIPNQS